MVDRDLDSDVKRLKSLNTPSDHLNLHSQHSHHNHHNDQPTRPQKLLRKNNHQKTQQSSHQPRKYTLFDWIKTVLPQVQVEKTHTTTRTINQPNQNQAKTKPHRQTQHRHQQTTLYMQTHNSHWGHKPSNSPHLFCIASKNVNSVSIKDNMLEWKGITNAMACHEINALSLQEPNTQWNEHLQIHIQNILQKSFRQATLVTSNSTKPSRKTHQPCGTTTAFVGKYTSRLLSKGQDPSGMGQWSFVKLLGKLNK